MTPTPMSGPSSAAQATRSTTLDRLLEASSDRNRRILFQGGTVISMDAAVGDFVRASVLVDGSRILAVGPDLDAAARDGQAIVVDATDMIVIPGMVDGHRHCWQNQFRRIIPNTFGNDAYIAVMHRWLALHYRPEDIYAGNLISALGAIDSGITCLLDFSHNSRSGAHSDAAIQAFVDAGIRGVHASAPPNAGEYDEQWPADLARLNREHAPSDDQLITLRLGVYGSPDLLGDLFITAEHLKFARELGLGVSVDGTIGHDPSLTVRPDRPTTSVNLQQLGKEGLLGPDVSLIHCLDLTEDAWQTIANSGTNVVLAATSDAQMGLAEGIPPIQQSLDHGIRPALSIDVEVTLTPDMFSQMRAVLWFQRMMAANRRYHGDEAPPSPITVRDVFEFATVRGAVANGLQDRIGSLSPGKQADIVLIRAEDINSMPLNNALGTVVSGSDSRNVDSVFVAGVARKWDGTLVGQDLGRVRDRIHASRDYVLAKSGYPLDILS
jgi:cytosine/adenosine deaminase-related metal-dependent hydrolase